MGMGRPGILDESFLENVPNVMPAGEAPWLKSNPTLTLPEAGQVRPEWNSVWIKPGMLLEPGTGFGPTGRSSALQQVDFPMFPFFFPGAGPFGYEPSPPSQSGQQGPESDYLGSALKQGANVLKSFAPTPETVTFMGPDSTAQAMQDVWGFSPKDNPNFSLNGPEEAGPQFPDVSLFPGENTSLLPPSEFINFNPAAILSKSPLFGGEVGPAMGFGAEPAFGLEGVTETGGPLFNLGVDTSLNMNPAQLISSPAAAGAGAALAASPFIFRALGLDNAARFTASPAFAAPAGFALAGASGAFAGAPFTGGLSAFAAPLTLAAMKIFDVGGRERRTASDAEELQNIIQRRAYNLALSQYRPDLLPYIQGAYGKWDANADIARLDEMERNHRLPQEYYDYGRNVVKQSEDPLKKVNYNPTPLQFDQNGRAMNLPKPVENAPDLSQIGLSEGELWRLMTVAAQQAQEEEARKQAEAARAAGIYDHADR